MTSSFDEDEPSTTTNQLVVENKISKKPRRPIPKIDAERLLSRNGISYIKDNISQVKFKGSGHEYSDLKKLIRFFEYWAEDLLPRVPFSYFIERVEKVCTSKRLKFHLSQWRGELSGIIVGSNESHIETDGTIDKPSNIPPPLSDTQLWNNLMENSTIEKWTKSVDQSAPLSSLDENLSDYVQKSIDTQSIQFQQPSYDTVLVDTSNTMRPYNSDDEDERLLRIMEKRPEIS